METIGFVFIYLASNEREIEQRVALNFMNGKKENILIVHIHEDEFNFTYSKSFIKENGVFSEYTRDDRKRLRGKPLFQYPTIYRNQRTHFADLEIGDRFDLNGIMYSMTKDGVKDESGNIVDFQPKISVVKDTY